MQQGAFGAGHTGEPPKTYGLLANAEGFSLHAGVTVHQNDRRGLERLLGYCGRGPIALSRLQQVGEDRCVYTMRKPLPDGRAALHLNGLELLKLLVAFIPPPYSNIVRYHGVFGPAAKLRSKVTGNLPALTPELAEVRASIPAIAAYDGPSLVQPSSPRPLLDRAKTKPRIIALIEDRDVARKILRHLGLPAEIPKVPPARAPPGQQDFWFEAA